MSLKYFPLFIILILNVYWTLGLDYVDVETDPTYELYRKMMATGKSNYIMRCKIHNVDQGYTMGFERTKDDHFIFQLWYHTKDDIQMVTYESFKTNEFFTVSNNYRQCFNARASGLFNTCQDCDVLCLKFYNVTNYQSSNKAIKFKAAIEQLFCDPRYSNQDANNCYNSRSDSFSCTDGRFPISLNVGSVFTSTASNGVVSVVPKDPEYILYRRMLATNPLNYILRCNMGNRNEDYTIGFERTRDNYFIFQLWYHGKDQIEKLFYSKNKTQDLFGERAENYFSCLPAKAAGEQQGCKSCNMICLTLFNMTHAQSPNKPITFRSTIQHITCPTTYWSNSDINKCRNNMIETKSCDIGKSLFSMNLGDEFVSKA